MNRISNGVDRMQTAAALRANTDANLYERLAQSADAFWRKAALRHFSFLWSMAPFGNACAWNRRWCPDGTIFGALFCEVVPCLE
jgi:hypothetical protein